MIRIKDGNAEQPANVYPGKLTISCWGKPMRVKLEIMKAGKRLHEGVYEIDDSASFAKAWADVWVKVREQCDAKATSIGALMDSMHESVIDELSGAEIRLRKI